MEKFNQQQNELLEELSKAYTNVLIMIDPTNTMFVEVYIVTEFREATHDNKFHSIRGWKKINHVLSDNSTFTNSKDIMGAIVTRIDDIPNISKERRFSEYFIWKKL